MPTVILPFGKLPYFFWSGNHRTPPFLPYSHDSVERGSGHGGPLSVQRGQLERGEDNVIVISLHLTHLFVY